MIQIENPDPTYASTMTLYQNGALTAIGLSTSINLTSTTVTAPIYINGRAGTTANSIPLYLAEVMVFTSPLTADQRSKIESYLAQKWNLGASLPDGHLNSIAPIGMPATTTQITQPLTIPKLTISPTLTITTNVSMTWISYITNVQSYTWVLYQSVTNAYAGTIIAQGTTTATSVTSSPSLTSNYYYYYILLATNSAGSYLATSPIVQYTSAGQATTFTYKGRTQTYKVPAGVTSVMVYLWGAGGGGNTNYGGAGAMVQGVLTTFPGETLNILVGQGGSTNGTTTFGGGGAGAGINGGSIIGVGYSGNGPFPNYNAGSGGGRSAIQRGGVDPIYDIVSAGGGGGGSSFSTSHGGSATFTGTANSGTGALPGGGGSQTTGGAGGGLGTYGLGLPGYRGIGGNTFNTNFYNGAGGGGGGYYGGGGGGTNSGDGGGGGGGSSYTSALSLISGQTVLGFNSTNGYTAPTNSSPYYVTGAGNGAPSTSLTPIAGSNGLVVIVPFPVSTTAVVTSITGLAAPTSLTLSISVITVTISWGAVSGALSYSWTLYQSATNAYAGSSFASGSTASTSVTATTSAIVGNYYYFIVNATTATAISSFSSNSSIVLCQLNIVSGALQSLDAATYTSGSTWTAAIGNNDTISGTATTTSTPGGSTAIVLNGSTYAQDLTGIAASSMASYTLDVWFYSAASQSATIIGELGQASLGGWNDSMISIASNIMYVGFWNGGVFTVNVGTYTANTWTHISYTYSGTTVLGYVNGVYVATGSTTKQWPTTMYMSVGGGANPYGNFTGQIGSFIVYGSALTATQIKQNYNARCGRYGLPTI